MGGGERVSQIKEEAEVIFSKDDIFIAAFLAYEIH